MGSATVGSYTLNSLVKVEREEKQNIIEQTIPGAASIMQAVGRKRATLILTGILNPSNEILAVQQIAYTQGNTAPFTITAITDVATTPTDWGMNSPLYTGLNPPSTAYKYFYESLKIGTQPGTRVPWGTYTLTFREQAGP